MATRVSKATVTESQNNRNVDWNNIIFKPKAPKNYHSTEYFEFPEKWLRNEYQKTKEDVWLAGFYSEKKGYILNFVLSDGNQYSKPNSDHLKFMMPYKCKSTSYVRVHLNRKGYFGIVYLDK